MATCNHAIFYGNNKTPRRCRSEATTAVVFYRPDGTRIEHGHRCRVHAEVLAKRFGGQMTLEAVPKSEACDYPDCD